MTMENALYQCVIGLVVITATVFQSPVVQAQELSCNGEVGPVITDTEYLENKKSVAPGFDKPTVVEVAIHLTKLTNINVIDSSLRFEAYGEFTWCDPREAFDPEVAGSEIKQILINPQTNNDLWTANLSISNGVGAAQVTESLTEIRYDGLVRTSGYFNSTVSVPFDLKKFPFDKQEFEIQMEPFQFNRDAVELRWKTGGIEFQRDIFLPEWKIEGVAGRIENTLDMRNRVPFSRAIFVVSVAREYGYYLYKLSVPLVLIVALSWTVFWMSEESLVNRMRVSATAFLTIVAYQFAVSNSLPKVAYLTIMDRLMIASFIMIALTALQNMLAQHTFKNRQSLAATIDYASRWLFPMIYFSVIILIIGVYLT
jgi:hypothetical protein